MYLIAEIETWLRDNIIEHDILALEAPTGSGKTLAVVSLFKEEQWRPYSVFMVVPTTALRSSVHSDEITVVTPWSMIRSYRTTERSKTIIIIDEAHVNNEHYQLLYTILRNDPPTKIILLSATLQESHCRDLFPVLRYYSFEGQPLYSTMIEYVPGTCASGVIHELAESRSGDAREVWMVYVACARDAKNLKEYLEECLVVSATILLRHGSMTNEEAHLFKDMINESDGLIIIICTNILDMGVTIPDVTVIIDVGWTYHSSSPTASIRSMRISKTMAIQRSGRTGRTCDGRVYRLYDEECYESMPWELPVEVDMRHFYIQLVDIGYPVREMFPDVGRTRSDLIVESILRPDDRLTLYGKFLARFPQYNSVIGELLWTHVIDSVDRCPYRRSLWAFAIFTVQGLGNRSPWRMMGLYERCQMSGLGIDELHVIINILLHMFKHNTSTRKVTEQWPFDYQTLATICHSIHSGFETIKRYTNVTKPDIERLSTNEYKSFVRNIFGNRERMGCIWNQERMMWKYIQPPGANFVPDRRLCKRWGDLNNVSLRRICPIITCTINDRRFINVWVRVNDYVDIERKTRVTNKAAYTAMLWTKVKATKDASRLLICEQIRNEVAYRPGNVGFCDLEKRFEMYKKMHI